jgi:DNA-binding IclR family transcriptional regulator
MKTATKKNKLNAIEKALEILITFTNTNDSLGNGEISKLTGFNKATTSRILSTLVEYGLVSHDDNLRKYKLGPLAYMFGLSGLSKYIQRFVDISSPHIDRLRDRLNESISFEVWSGSGTVACYFAESQNPLRVAKSPADILPLHAPAGAKAILAFTHLEQTQKLLDYEFEAFTENTILSKIELFALLEKYNRQGYAVDNEELHSGIYALGVPVFDHLSKPVAAICMVIPVSRVSYEKELEAVEQLKKTACIISAELKKLPSPAFRLNSKLSN